MRQRIGYARLISTDDQNLDLQLVACRLERLRRSRPDLVQIVVELEHSGTGFSTAGTLFSHVFAMLAEFERAFYDALAQIKSPGQVMRNQEHSLTDGSGPKLKGSRR